MVAVLVAATTTVRHFLFLKLPLPLASRAKRAKKWLPNCCQWLVLSRTVDVSTFFCCVCCCVLLIAYLGTDHHCSDLVCQQFGSASLSLLFGLCVCSVPLAALKLISSLLFALCALLLLLCLSCVRTAYSNSDHHYSDLVCKALRCFSSESLSFLFGLFICPIPLVWLKLISSLLFALCTLFFDNFFNLCQGFFLEVMASDKAIQERSRA